jgi:phage tail-like protein
MHFIVQFQNNDLQEDYRFQSVQGLKASLIKEEGVKLPRAIFENIILRRAFEPDSKLVEWCMDTINNKVFKHETITIKLLDNKHELISGWIVTDAIPVAWSVEELHAQDSKVLIESIELKYKNFQVLNSKGQIIAPKKPKNKRLK